MLEKIKSLKDGDKWEEYINKFYRLRYQKQGYQSIPAQYEGDTGIEGYTKTGIVYQCYCPEKDYSYDELYEHQRDKVTKDIKKLIENGEKIKSVGVHCKIKEWHFVIPEYKDKRILQHCSKKREEVLNAKKNNNLDYIDDEFDIIIKVAEDFFTEISQLVFLDKEKFDITLKDFEMLDLNECNSEKLMNIKNKLKKIIDPEEDVTKYNSLLKIIEGYYIKGIKIKDNIKKTSPELYEMILSIDGAYKSDLEIRCLMNSDKALNKSIFDETIKKLNKDLHDNMNNILDEKSISELKYDLISSWIADCPMDFV